MMPTELDLSKDKISLTVRWPDGKATAISASYLRQHCNSASAKRARLDEIDTILMPELTINDIRAIGRYAVNLVFSDGHDRGIYPWAYLRDLGEKSAIGN